MKTSFNTIIYGRFWGGWLLGVVGVGGGTTFALLKMCPQTNLLFD